MRVAIDCRAVTAPKTGDRTYALNLIRGLAAVDCENQYLLYTSEPTEQTQLGRPNMEAVVLPADPAWWWTPFLFPDDLKRSSVSLGHVQYITPLSAPVPFITTIHDIAFRRYPGLFPLKHRLLLNALVPLCAWRSARVLTGSESTRQDLLEFYRLPAEKVVVTPYAADSQYRPLERETARRQVSERFGIRTPYLLSVGVLQPRKNLPRLVEAFARIARRVPHRLVIVGKWGWAHESLQDAVRRAGLGERICFAGYVADADLPALYCAADIFVYPSLYEGFGLPPLEAMACGTPVVAGATSSLPEVVGDAGVLVDPRDVGKLADAISSLLTDERERMRLRERGLRQASRFSWEETARRTVEVYRQVDTGGKGIMGKDGSPPVMP
jgi:glycosyltransferase involved in cell wall biosynthesis